MSTPFSLNDVQQARINAVTSTTPIVAAPGAGYRIVVLSWILTLDTDGEITWASAATTLLGAMEVTADTPVGVSCGVAGVMHCAANEALNLTSTTAANGMVRYVRVRV